MRFYTVNRIFASTIVLGSVLLLSIPSNAGQGDESGEKLRCMHKRHISSFIMEDDKTIRFVTSGMKGNYDVLARTKHACPQMAYVITLRFTSTSNDRVCARFDSLIVDQFIRCRINSLTLAPKIGSKAEKAAKKVAETTETPDLDK